MGILGEGYGALLSPVSGGDSDGRGILKKGTVELVVDTSIVLETILSVLDGTAEAELNDGIGLVALIDVRYMKTLENGRRMLLVFAWVKK